MQRMEKQEAAASLAALLKAQTAVFSFDYRGLSVADVTDLRRRVREAGGQYRVVKNSTAKWAFEEAGISGLDDQLAGMTGLAWSEDDPVALAQGAPRGDQGLRGPSSTRAGSSPISGSIRSSSRRWRSFPARRRFAVRSSPSSRRPSGT